MMASILLENVTKSFTALQKYCNVYDLNFEVKDGEFFCFVGPTNSGKTTTLRLVAGLEKPDTGSVFMDGVEVNEVPPSYRQVGMLFESLALYPNKTGFDNLASPLRIQKAPKHQIIERVMEVAKLLRIDHLLDRTPQTFSGGERQRVALGRIFVQRPDIYLLDEPLGALDARLRISTRAELKRMQRDMGKTMILVSHDQEEAMSMGNRVGVLREGRIEQIGTPQELYNYPTNVYVARSIGKPAMNFYECALEQRNGSIFVVHEQFSMDITSSLSKVEQPKSREVILGIRPEHIEIEENKGHEEDVSAKVCVCEPQGSKTIIDCLIGDQSIRTLAPLEKQCARDESRWLRFKKEKVHLFEKESEKVIF
jgi:ABC-type sugar transport system ATPase subunit